MHADDLAFLQSLVDINTSTDNPDGLDEARRPLITAFEQIGFDCTEHPLANRRKLLVFEPRDAQFGPGGAPALALVGHLDTVFKKSSPFQKLRIEQDQLIGPGVIDMKGGIALMLRVLQQPELKQLRRRTRVLINDDEEIGLPASHQKLFEICRNTPAGLVFEPGLPDGAVVTSHSGAKWFKLSVRGKAAHAGLEPENGINAGVELASKVVKVAALADLEKGLSVNPGIIQAGTKANVVCEEGHAVIDVRYPSEEELKKVDHAMERIRSESLVYNPKLGAGATASLETVAHLPLMPASSSARLFELLQQSARAVGQKIQGRHVGYVSDANHLAPSGMQLLVGLGPYGGGMHTESEFMLTRSFEERARLCTDLIARILSAN